MCIKNTKEKDKNDEEDPSFILKYAHAFTFNLIYLFILSFLVVNIDHPYESCFACFPYIHVTSQIYFNSNNNHNKG